MSPERVRGDSYNTAADIWSFGVVAYECAVGSSPFKVEANLNIFEFLKAIEEPITVPPSVCAVLQHTHVNACCCQIYDKKQVPYCRSGHVLTDTCNDLQCCRSNIYLFQLRIPAHTHQHSLMIAVLCCVTLCGVV